MPAKWGVIGGLCGVMSILLWVYSYIFDETYSDAEVKTAKAAIQYELVDNVSALLEILEISEVVFSIESGSIPLDIPKYLEHETLVRKLSVEKALKYSDALIESDPKLVFALREHYVPMIIQLSDLTTELGEDKKDAVKQIHELSSSKRMYEIFEVFRTLFEPEDEIWDVLDLDHKSMSADELTTWIEDATKRIEVHRFLMQLADLVVEPQAAYLLWMCNSHELQGASFNCEKHLLDRNPEGTKSFELLGGAVRPFNMDPLLVISEAKLSVEQDKTMREILEKSGFLKSLEYSVQQAASEFKVNAEQDASSKLMSAFGLLKMKETLSISSFVKGYSELIFEDITTDELRLLHANFNSNVWKEYISIKNRPEYFNKINNFDLESADTYLENSDVVKVSACTALETATLDSLRSERNKVVNKLLETLEQHASSIGDLETAKAEVKKLLSKDHDFEITRRIAACVESRRYLSIPEVFELDTIRSSTAFRKFDLSTNMAINSIVVLALSETISYMESL